jgi:putative mRNA 3-end processing factor
MYEVKADKTILFTGDIQTDDTYLMNGVKPRKTDILVVESTYAGKVHEDRKTIEHKFLEMIENIVDRGGTAIIPAFAVGRTQEVMMILADKGYEVWVDGMGTKVLSIFLKYPSYLRDWKALKHARDTIHQVKKRKDREKALKGDVIISTGGMLDGGPALNYINQTKNDGKSAILLTGYQVEGSNGRMLMDESILNLYGVDEKISMDVHFFDFSAHADHNGLVKFINGCNPETVILCHGENREALLPDLSNYNVLIPKNGEEIILP